jgi:hypothetical protein
MWVADGADEHRSSSPGACVRLEPPKTPSTELVGLAFRGRAASVDSPGVPCMRIEDEPVDSHSSEAEARALGQVSDEVQLLPELCPPRQGLQPPEQSTSVSEPEAACSLHALIKRLERMLFGDGDLPRASGLDGVTLNPTVGFVDAVRMAAGKLWEAHEDDIKRDLAPLQVDEVDCIAYLVADALGRPLLHPDDRNALGKRVLTQATRAAAAIKAAEKTAADAVRRAKAAAAADPSKLPRVAAAEIKGATDVAAVRNKPTPDLQLPARTVGKRVRERESPDQLRQLMPPPPPRPPRVVPPPPPLSFEEAVARAVHTELARQEAARVEAAREAEAARVAAQEQAREDAARAAVPRARSRVAAAERTLKRAQRALAQQPVPAFDEPPFTPPPGITCLPQTFPAWKAAHDEYHEQVFCPYSDWWHAEFSKHYELDMKVGEAEVELECAQEDLIEAEAAVTRRLCVV